ncbi:MAG: DNA-binding transcriptional LysR family regulator [Gammaproteobacteria bacterium]|jgi:DNA-binding transcriptional LysR family regulator
MDTQQITAFIAVAEESSFTLAAERLYLTQPAISKRINLLEQFLGNRLFDRIGKQIKLTEAGQVLMPHAKKILREIEDTRNAVQNLSQSVSGRLTLASSHHIGLHRLPPVLKQYSEAYKEVSIDISFQDSEKAYDQISHGEIELAVVTLANRQKEKIVSHVLWEDELCIMTSQNHPLTKYKLVTLNDLLDFPAILPGGNTFTRQLIEEIFQDEKLKLEVEMSTNYLETIKMMVSVGMAWSVLPLTMHDNSVRVLPIKNFMLKRQLGYIFHQEHTLSNAATAFIECLNNYST